MNSWVAVGQPGRGRPLTPPLAKSIHFLWVLGRAKSPAVLLRTLSACCAASPQQSRAEQGLMLTEEDFQEGFGEVAFFWSGRQVWFLWEPRGKCPGNLLTDLRRFAEAVDARSGCLRWSDHRSGGAGDSWQRVPEVSAVPLQPSADRAGGFPAPAQTCTCGA